MRSKIDTANLKTLDEILGLFNLKTDDTDILQKIQSVLSYDDLKIKVLQELNIKCNINVSSIDEIADLINNKPLSVIADVSPDYNVNKISADTKEIIEREILDDLSKNYGINLLSLDDLRQLINDNTQMRGLITQKTIEHDEVTKKIIETRDDYQNMAMKYDEVLAVNDKLVKQDSEISAIVQKNSTIERLLVDKEVKLMEYKEKIEILQLNYNTTKKSYDELITAHDNFRHEVLDDKRSLFVVSAENQTNKSKLLKLKTLINELVKD